MRSPPQWLLAWALGSVALGGASLLIPLYVIELGGSAFILGILAATAALVGAPGAFIFGRIADRTGSFVLFIESALVTVTACLAVLPFIENLTAVVALNAVVWFCFAAIGPSLTLLSVEGAAEEDWQNRIAQLNTFQGWGWTAGLVVGAVWSSVAVAYMDTIAAQRYFFWGCAVAGALGAIGIGLAVPERSAIRQATPRTLRLAIRNAPRFNIRGATFPFTPGRVTDWTSKSLNPQLFIERFSPRLSVYYVAVLLFFGGFAVFFAPLPIFLDDTGFSSGAIFVLYLVSSLGAAIFFGRAGALAGSYNLGSLQALGLAIRGTALPAVALAGAVLGATVIGLGVVTLVFLLIGVAWALIAVTAATLVSRLAAEEIRGEALGVYAAASALAGAIGSFGGGWLASLSYTLAFGIAGALVVLGAGLVLTLRATVAQAKDA